MLRVLGGVEVCRGEAGAGAPVNLGHPKQRCVLAALVVDRDRAVSADVLVSRVWGASAPPRARETVHSHLSRLRRALGAVRGAAIVRRSGGYALETTTCAVDLHLFQDLRAAARSAGSAREAAARLSDALALWRGPALAGLSGEWAESERERLERERLAARLDLVQARLRLGEHAGLLGELAALATEHRYDERVAHHYLLALHHCGRTAEALAHYRRFRDHLAGELGVEPGAPLRDLHRLLLGGGAAGPGVAAVPRQLPPAVRDFTGRAESLAALDALLPSAGGGQAVVISAVDGSAGIGKTTLAVYWAHRVAHRFPDGTLHVDLRGYGPGQPVTADEALAGFLLALGVTTAAMPAGTAARTGLLRTLLAGRRMLLVLDNANSAEQVRPMLPGTAGCMVLVTSRDRLTGLVVTDAAHQLTLDLLSPAEALRLVTGILGTGRAAEEATAVRQLIGLCAHLPLALRIAAGRVAAHRDTSVAGVVAELAGGDRSRLDALDWGRDPYAAVRTVLDWSYERLTPMQALLLRRIGLHPGPDVSLPAAAALLQLPPHDVRPVLADLVRANLVSATAGDRYQFHDLLRAYAADKAMDVESPAERRRATAALLRWYGHTAHRADRLLYPTSTRLVDAAPAPPHPHSLTDRDGAWSWLSAERANLVAALHHAVDAEHDGYAVRFVDAFGFLILLGRWEDRIDTASAGLVSARRTPDRAHEANVLLARGEALGHLDRPAETEADLRLAAELARETGTVPVRIAALSDLGRLLLGQDRHAEAVQHLENALVLSRGVDTGRWEAIIDGMLADAHAGLGDHARAIEHGERSAGLRSRIGDHDGEACALTSLARAWRSLGEHDRAAAHCRQAIALGRASLGSQDETLAPPLTVLATLLHRQGRVAEAVACWQEAAVIYTERGLDSDAAVVRDQLRTTAASEQPGH